MGRVYYAKIVFPLRRDCSLCPLADKDGTCRMNLGGAIERQRKKCPWPSSKERFKNCFSCHSSRWDGTCEYQPHPGYVREKSKVKQTCPLILCKDESIDYEYTRTKNWFRSCNIFSCRLCQKQSSCKYLKEIESDTDKKRKLILEWGHKEIEYPPLPGKPHTFYNHLGEWVNGDYACVICAKGAPPSYRYDHHFDWRSIERCEICDSWMHVSCKKTYPKIDKICPLCRQIIQAHPGEFKYW